MGKKYSLSFLLTYHMHLLYSTHPATELSTLFYSILIHMMLLETAEMYDNIRYANVTQSYSSSEDHDRLLS